MNKATFIIVALLTVNSAWGQRTKKTSLKWKVRDSILYNTCFDEINKEFPDSVKLVAEHDSTRQLLFTEMKRLNKDFLNASFKSKMVKKKKNSYQISLSTLGIPVSKTETNAYGIPTTTLPDREKNFYLFFFQLPNKKVRVGDEWKLGLVVPKNLSSIKVTDSIKQDKVKLTAIETTATGEIAVISYLYIEEYRGVWTNTKTNEPVDAKISFHYKAIGRFNIDSGKWEDLDGVMDLVSKGPMDARSIRHICMQQVKQ